MKSQSVRRRHPMFVAGLVLRPIFIEALERRLMFASVEFARLVAPAASEFVATINHPYLPLLPGTSFELRGTDGEGGAMRIESRVLPEKKKIAGVECTVTHVREFVDGELVEETFDWHAQDRAGNVWYFGEDTTEIEDEIISRDGAWQSGVDGAEAGLVMPARPRSGFAYRQENFPGEAEDRARILFADGEFATPLGRFSDGIVIEETNPLAPDVLERKYYARGIGLVFSEGVFGETEDLVLVSRSNSSTRVDLAPRAAEQAANRLINGNGAASAGEAILGDSPQDSLSEIFSPFTLV